MCIFYRSGTHHLAITIHQLHGKPDILLSAEMTLCPIIHVMKPPGPTSYVDSFSKIASRHAFKNVFYPFLLIFIKHLS